MRLATGLGDAPAERALATKEATGHGLVDDEDLRGSEGVACVEGASVEHAGADGFEIVGTDAVDDGDGLMAGLGSLAAGDEVLAGLGQTEEGHRVGEAGGCDAGQRFETFQGEALEVRDLLAARVGGGREEHGAGDEVVGLPTVAAVVQLVEAAREEGGAREQDHGEGELADDEDVAEALMAAISGGAARSALERPVQIEPEGEERGGDAEGEGREETGAERPAEHAPVEGEHESLVTAIADVSCSASASRWSTWRTEMAQMPPAKASSRDSTNRGRSSRTREAPRAERTANSRARAIVRASSRFARLEQAMSSTKPERPISMPNMPGPLSGATAVVDREGAPGGSGVGGGEARPRGGGRSWR